MTRRRSVSVTGWSEDEIKQYLDQHTDDSGEWDGAPWPATITTQDGEFCPVCKYTRTDGRPTGTASPDYPHDCVYQPLEPPVAPDVALREAAQYLSPADSARILRAHLKREFPRVKFGVRTEVYSMGSAIRVSWTDGPTEASVKRITDPYAGRGFDGMVDLAYERRRWLMPDGTLIYAGTSGTGSSLGCVPAEHRERPEGAVPIDGGAASVTTSRGYSLAFLQRALERAQRKWGAGVDGVVIDGANGSHPWLHHPSDYEAQRRAHEVCASTAVVCAGR